MSALNLGKSDFYDAQAIPHAEQKDTPLKEKNLTCQGPSGLYAKLYKPKPMLTIEPSLHVSLVLPHAQAAQSLRGHAQPYSPSLSTSCSSC